MPFKGDYINEEIIPDDCITNALFGLFNYRFLLFYIKEKFNILHHFNFTLDRIDFLASLFCDCFKEIGCIFLVALMKALDLSVSDTFSFFLFPGPLFLRKQTWKH